MIIDPPEPPDVPSPLDADFDKLDPERPLRLAKAALAPRFPSSGEGRGAGATGAAFATGGGGASFGGAFAAASAADLTT